MAQILKLTLTKGSVSQDDLEALEDLKKEKSLETYLS